MNASEQLRQEHRHHDRGGVDHGSPHLEGRLADDLEARPRRLEPRVLPQAAHDVLDADDRIVHQHTERHREAAERHGVEREAHVVENRDGGEERQRYCAEGDERGTHVAEEGVQHGEDQHGRENQRLFEIRQRALDEIGGPVQTRVQLDPLGPQRRRERRQRALDRSRHRRSAVPAPSSPRRDRAAGWACCRAR